MTIKDLTKEQMQEITRLAYGSNNGIKSDIRVKYQPFVPWSIKNNTYEDVLEEMSGRFRGFVFGDIDLYQIEVLVMADLNVWVYYYSERSPIYGSWKSLPTRNQYQIQKNFRDWNINPSELICYGIKS